MNELDTIVAPATPVARSALAIVRIDGTKAASILATLAGNLPEVRTAAHIKITFRSELLDDCVAVRYEAPRSFTGNDLVELTLHGSPLVVRRVIEAVVALGARLAEPGEFTERAVLNGKIDLVQAESIADLIDARTALQAKLSLENLDGVLSTKAREIRETLLHVISRLEAALDFSEEGYEFIRRDEAKSAIDRALEDVRAIAATYQRGRATSTGLSLVILGRPNAGKSTLLNRLVGSERAIVTPVPGTTRDIVRETIEIGGLPVTIADTAGIRSDADLVEEIGIARAKEAAREADIVLHLVDATNPHDDLGEINSTMTVYNKRDLAEVPAGAIAISAATGDGMDNFLLKLDALVREKFAAPESSPTIVNERQRAAIAECEDGLTAARASIDADADEHFIVVDLYRAANALGVLVGAITRDDVFTEIFAKFCIGK